MKWVILPSNWIFVVSWFLEIVVTHSALSRSTPTGWERLNCGQKYSFHTIPTSFSVFPNATAFCVHIAITRYDNFSHFMHFIQFHGKFSPEINGNPKRALSLLLPFLLLHARLRRFDLVWRTQTKLSCTRSNQANQDMNFIPNPLLLTA